MTEVLGRLRIGGYDLQPGASGAVQVRLRDNQHKGVYPEYITAELAAEDFEVILARIVEELR